eukprot:scaffold102707_cov67-Phaeocystis_antarctica.AAC.5
MTVFSPRPSARGGRAGAGRADAVPRVARGPRAILDSARLCARRTPSTCSLRIRAIRFFHIGDDANRLVRAFVQLQGFCCTCRHSRRLGRQARHALVRARWRRTEDVWVAWA